MELALIILIIILVFLIIYFSVMKWIGREGFDASDVLIIAGVVHVTIFAVQTWVR